VDGHPVVDLETARRRQGNCPAFFLFQHSRLARHVYNDIGMHGRTLGLTLLVAIIAGGCHSGSDLMPLHVGQSWLYSVKSGFETNIDTLKVAGETSVANTRGYEIVGSLGVSRLAWSGDTLLAEKVSGTQFEPPFPLLFNAEETHERPWKGRVTFVDRSSPASGSQSQRPDEDLSFGGKKIHCVCSTAHIKTAAHQIELITWFSPGLGIVQQEQRTDGTLQVRLSLLDVK
jgi:hypothetical protein